MPECPETGKKITRECDYAETLNTITPCAACKLLRRRCAQQCAFSPYFSPHHPHKFASVHKVFGASNVSKMLMDVPERQRADAANSLVYEANTRLRDPIYGCMGAISILQHQLQLLQAQLNAVRAEILKYKYKNQPNVVNFYNNITVDVNPSFKPHYDAASGFVSILASPPVGPLSPAPLLVPSPELTLPLTDRDNYSSISSENLSDFGKL